jgi:NAD(P)-dependent dehydrogenase (short-subunit alcohol dehydrogenase family)
LEGLAGKRALITGGAAGIGRAIALKLAREGCDIALLDIDGKAAEATAAEVRALGRDAKATKGDVSDMASVRAALAQLTAKGAPIDILVNNAGHRPARLLAHHLRRRRCRASPCRMSTACSMSPAPSCRAWPRQAGLYRIVNRMSGRITYIGVSNNIRRRMGEHRRAGRFVPNRDYFYWQRAKLGTDLEAIFEHEVKKITQHKPRDNQRLGRGGRRGAVQTTEKIRVAALEKPEVQSL